jgi:hypothetical protein
MVSVGGSGGGGGSSDTVTIINGGSIRTDGQDAPAIFAQSVGGGGGNGGSAGSVSAFAGVAVGGSGATGGDGGDVDLTLQGTDPNSASVIHTSGDRSTGIFAQSVGGGGGNGGGAVQVTGGYYGAVSVAVGGSGAAGGEGGTVNLSPGDGGINVVETEGDDATGVFVQSVGGGGGNGGYSVSVAAAGGDAGSGSLSVAVGGSGGPGGLGGTVNVGAFDVDGNLESAGFTGSILTHGDHSTGFLAQSVGGGGGNGGLAVSVPVGASAGVSISLGIGVGGAGGVGGIGGDVNVGYEGNITTEGHNATGMLVQSVGGGGGNGGGSVTTALAGAGAGAGAVSLGVGGDAGNGSSGGTVRAATRSGTITTSGLSATGIIVQSVGGGGGNGGYTVSAGVAGAGTGAGSINAGLGGKGGTGSTGGSVFADLESDVITNNDESTGILVQSVGGGGGNGGFSIAGGIAAAGTGSGAVSVGLGGGGGAGGDGGAVIAASRGAVSTWGDSSGGLIVQSVGGGGGNGGFNVSGSLSAAGTGGGAVSVGLGGSGGGGGIGGTVTAISEGDIFTRGDDSAGILSQSVGGGGGNGGFNVNVALSGAGTGSGAVGVGLGGSGGAGADGGLVNLTVTNDVTTLGKDSVGVIAQSVGGGGGNGGFNVTVAGSGAGTGSGGVGVGLGGSAAGGGTGSDVTSDMTGNILTEGENSTGLLVQSVGGGGGNGGFNVTAAISATTSGTGNLGASVGLGGAGGTGGDSGTVFSSLMGDVFTMGDRATGVIAQSLGGGGGNGGVNVSGTLALASGTSGAASVGLGGSGGDGGHAVGTVTNIVTGNISTQGEGAGGVLAQSVGGGGGNGALNVSGAISASSQGSGAVSVGLGGSGGGGGMSSEVTNTVIGNISTQGKDAFGVIAQSVGGGGGSGGTNVSGSLSLAKTTSGSVAVGIGGAGGAGGMAADVTNTVNGGVITLGDNATAILAQSLGGGGGNGGVNVSGAVNGTKEGGGALAVGVGGLGGDGGDAGNVISTVIAPEGTMIGTAGDNASAVVAQSVGGGGGNGGVNVSGVLNATGKSGASIGVGVGGFGGGGGTAHDVTLGVAGDVVTEGHDSHGVFAQSLGGGGGNGGVNVTGGLNINKEGTGGAASIGFGGFGGGGGDSGAVTVAYQGTIDATPDDDEGPGSHGLLAQSLAGGGGNGAVNVSAGLAFSSREKGDGDALVVGVGGFGGEGGDAGAVDVTVTEGSSITAFGDDRSAIFAQSVGGGGGNGGVNVSGGIATDAPIVLGMGGFGGNGGTADTVTVTASADLQATGTNARGLFAQSVGGGGGNGGLNVSGSISYNHETGPPAITFGMGGFGGAGNTSSNVTVAHLGNILTSGAEGHGIFAQSVAGGGGNGGLNVATSLIGADKKDSGGYKDLSITGGIGGHGGEGADAGDTSVSSSGDIMTTGDYARGVFAQSIGGGGGNGGMNFTGNVAKKSSLVTFGVGGFGGGGGNAGEVSVYRGDLDTPAGAILTNGIGALGIEATSIGGGGGDAGFNLVAAVSLAGDASGGGDGGGSDGGGDSTERPHPKNTGVDPEVFVNYDKVLDELEGRQKKDKESDKQKKDESGFAVQVAVGGNGGGAGDGGDSSVSNRGDVETLAQQSHGILAQSIGGGGGNAAMNIALTYLSGDSLNRGLNVSLGGAPGDGGAGGTVSVDHEGTLITHGADSYGIVAQSIGGGGGNASAFISKAKDDASKLDISIGRRGGSGGEGGSVTLDSAGTVYTYGDRSWGLIAQSIGNGGGNSSATTISGGVQGEKGKADRGGSLSVGLEGGEGGGAGDVTLTARGLVGTEGASAHAIFAQSVGGGGGNGGDASASSANASVSLGGSGGEGGTGGTVDVTSSADIRTLGADAYGVIAQSIGGGGGTGGKSEATIESTEPGVDISIGGTGGTGSVGGTVGVANAGSISTSGANAIGVFAQSLGGGGGNGGMSITSLKTKKKEPTTGTGTGDGSSGSDGGGSGGSSEPFPVQVGVNVGGSGGEGADGGSVTVTNTGSVGTGGRAAAGIFAQSIGGGGGNADQVISKFSGAGAKINTGIGGAGGVGGAGGDVTVENLIDDDGNAAEIVTTGDDAYGIVAMSIGGGGGNGSTAISENEQEASSLGDAAQGPRTLGVSVAVGGSGGTGGTSGLVTVTNDGRIATHGDGAHGIFAQSIGGGGGNGGVTYSKDPGLKGINSSTDIDVTIGGVGGSGNVSGDVEVHNTGAIEVFGDGAYGVFAQSIGGGGGNGGMSGAAPAEENGASTTGSEPEPQSYSQFGFSLGGAGGDGANSGNVLVDHQGSIVVHGDDAYGIFAQSIAGGGGTAGGTYSTYSGAVAEFALPLLLGSRDGGTGEAGRVTLNTDGDITMLGDGSKPYLAQSVNGGGGNLRLSLDASNTTLGRVTTGPGKPEDPLSAFIHGLLQMGSDAVEAGLGAAIDSEHAGDLLSLGNGAPASSTQSIGGGGGNADVTLTVNPDAVIDLQFLLGGSGSVNSSGGDISLVRDGNATTMGDASAAVSVQSIGGGGGFLNLAVSTVPGPETATASTAIRPTPIAALGPVPMTEQRTQFAPLAAETVAIDPADSTASVTLGADGSTGNDGGAVDASYTGDAVTEGDLSPGLLVQSIGAGGGQAQVSGVQTLTVELGGTNGATGDGGDISVTNAGLVQTSGLRSHGVVAQSIGGGGGTVMSDAGTTSLVLRDANAGSGGNVTLAQNGDVHVTGEGAIAVLAQSVGGGGGAVDRTFFGSAGGDGDAGAVNVTLDGSAQASGQAGVGAFLQSAAADDDGQQNLSLTVARDGMVSGGHDGIGVWFSGGSSNRISNRGAIGTTDDVDGLAILAEGGDNEVDNHGSVIGSVDLGAGTNRFVNREDAYFAPGASVRLGGPGNLLGNAGSFSPWGGGRAGRVLLSGSYDQSASGTTFSEIDFASDTHDELISTGSATLDGSMDVSLLNVRFIPVGDYRSTLVFAADGVTDAGLVLDTKPSVVINYGLDWTAQALDLGYAIDFVPEGMGDNLNAVGAYINRGQQAGGGNAAYGELIELLVDQPDLPSYKNALTQLSPEFFAEQQVGLIDSGVEFDRRLMSCEQAGGEHRFTREGTCIWLQFENEEQSLDRHDDYRGIDSSAVRISLGAQKTLENDWTFGAGFSRERTESDGFGERWQSSTLLYQLGLSAKRRFGASKIAAVLGYGWSDADSSRSGVLLEPFNTDLSRDADIFSLTVRAQHDFEGRFWYLRPMIDLGVLHLRADSASEQGLGAAGLVFDDYDETHTWIRPAIQLGREFELGTDYRLRFNVGVGAQQYLSDTHTTVKAGLAGAPDGIAPISMDASLGDPRYDATVGVDFLTTDNVVVKLHYQRSWSDHRDADAVRLKLEYPL